MERRRGVTRGYVTALIAATGVVAVALVVASWGMIALASGGSPVTTPTVPTWAAPLLVFVALVELVIALWQQAVVLLRGKQSPAWGLILAAAVGSYLWWSLGGMIVGMSIAETWLSAYALALALAWLLANLAFWAVLMRRVYSDRPTPQWPWERAGEDDAS